ncbi:MAG: hypothetical protein WC391_06465 [Methanoregula sp.]|jgi:hypothetical protein
MPDQCDHSAAGSPGNGCAGDTSTSADAQFLREIATGMSLERVVEITQEFTHLNQLIVRHIEKGGGFTSTGAYFKSVQPVLDMLEIEIRVRYCPGMTRKQMKLIIQDWIDQEIRELE